MTSLNATSHLLTDTVGEPADTVNAKVTAVTVNEKVVVAGREGAGPVPVTVIVTVPAVAVDVAEEAKMTVHRSVGDQVGDAVVGTKITRFGRADSETKTRA